MGSSSAQYSLEISKHADLKFSKMAKKKKWLLEVIRKKVGKILENPEHFKPLRGDMHGARRVHFDKSFVLTYEIDFARKVVRILDFEHHDKVY
jgi:mRNA interferase RelE/StbE/toxin YoeB